nr:hypothetical protein CFP56_38082 [Quercus suber]
MCELCNEGSEDVLHALWKCKVEADDFQKEIFTVSAWYLWNRRNALHFGRTVQPIANISSMTSNLLQEFLAAQEEDDLLMPLPPTQHQWQPPEEDSFKVNYDAAVFKTLNSAGIGVVVSFYPRQLPTWKL